MAIQQRIRDVQGTPHLADFVFEKVAQGFDQGKFHALGQSTHIVVGFDGSRWPVDRHRFDDIGVNGALPQKRHLGHGTGLLFETGNKSRTDGLALGFGVRESGQDPVKFMARIHPPNRQSQVSVGLQHFLVFVEAQQSIIHEHAVQSFPDGLVE